MEKRTKSSKLTDTERHKRFVDMAHKLDIPDDADLSPELFRRLVKPARSKSVGDPVSPTALKDASQFGHK
jgi:hypothetical protein